MAPFVTLKFKINVYLTNDVKKIWILKAYMVTLKLFNQKNIYLTCILTLYKNLCKYKYRYRYRLEK